MLYLYLGYGFVLSNQEGVDQLFIDFRISAKLLYCNKSAIWLIVFLPDFSNEFSGRPFFTAGDIHNVFSINNYTIWDRLLHNPACSERLLLKLKASFYSCVVNNAKLFIRRRVSELQNVSN